MATETRGVYGGAYRSEKSLEQCKTHLVEMGEHLTVLKVYCGRVKLDHIVEDGCAYTEEELADEPTCKSCAAKWRKLRAGRL